MQRIAIAIIIISALMITGCGRVTQHPTTPTTTTASKNKSLVITVDGRHLSSEAYQTLVALSHLPQSKNVTTLLATGKQCTSIGSSIRAADVENIRLLCSQTFTVSLALANLDGTCQTEADSQTSYDACLEANLDHLTLAISGVLGAEQAVITDDHVRRGSCYSYLTELDPVSEQVARTAVSFRKALEGIGNQPTTAQAFSKAVSRLSARPKHAFPISVCRPTSRMQAKTSQFKKTAKKAS